MALSLQRATSISNSPAVDNSSLVVPPFMSIKELGRAVTTDHAPAPLDLSREPSCALVGTFEKFNDSGDGFLRVDEFVRHVMALPGFSEIRHGGRPLDEETLRSITEAVASDTGTINLLQF